MITFVFSLSLSLKCDGNQVFGHRASSKALRKGTTTTSSDKSNSSNHRRFLPAHSRQFGSRPANSPARNQNGKSFGQSVLKRWRNRRPPNSSLSRYLKIAGLQYTTHLHTHTRTYICTLQAHTHTQNAKTFTTGRWMELNRWWWWIPLSYFWLRCCKPWPAKCWFVVSDYCLTLLERVTNGSNPNQCHRRSEREARNH